MEEDHLILALLIWSTIWFGLEGWLLGVRPFDDLGIVGSFCVIGFDDRGFGWSLRPCVVT